MLAELSGRVSEILEEALRSALPGALRELGIRAEGASFSDLRVLALGSGDSFSVQTSPVRNGNAVRDLAFIYSLHSEPKAFSGGEILISAGGAANGGNDTPEKIEPNQNQLLLIVPGALIEVATVDVESRAFKENSFLLIGQVVL